MLSRLCVAFVSVCLLPIGAPALTLTTNTWTGGGATGGWGQGSNWVGNVAPTFTNTLDVFFVATSDTTNLLAFLGVTNRTVHSVNFNSNVIVPITNVLGSSIAGGTPRDLTIGGGNDGKAGIFIDANATGNIYIGRGTNGLTAGNVIMGENLTISNASATSILTINDPITGAYGLTNSGAGVVIFSGTNTYTGVTYLNGGTLVAGTSNALSSGGITFSGAGGTLQYIPATKGVDWATRFTNSTAAISLRMEAGVTVTLAGVIGNSNTGGLIKTGAGLLRLTGVNTYSGNTYINGGALSLLKTNTVLGYNTPGRISVASNAVLAVRVGGAGQWDYTARVDLATNASMAAGSLFGFDTTSASTTIPENLTDVSVSIGYAKLGANTLTLTGSNSYTGPTWLMGGTLEADNAHAFGNAGDITFLGGALRYLPGNTNMGWETRFKNSTSAIQLDMGEGTNITLSGNIDNSNTGGLTKTGAGVLELTGTNEYSGTTAINGGQLVLNHSTVSGTGSGAVNVNSGGTLTGTGTVYGAVTVAAGGTLTPGTELGVLTIQGDLNLQGTVSLHTWKSGTNTSCARISVAGTLLYGGTSTLTLTHNGDPLVGGEVFKLFEAANFTGAFYAWNLPPLDPCLNWCFDRLTIDGCLTVNRTPVAGPLNLQTQAGIPLESSLADVLASCHDLDDDSLTVLSLGSIASGTVTLNPDGQTFTYQPAEGFIGLDSFTYTISDGRGNTYTRTNQVLVADPRVSPYNRLSSPVLSNSTCTVQCAGFPGYSYILQRSTNLLANAWENIQTATVPSDGVLTFTDTSLPSPAPPAVFYRAEFELGTATARAAEIFQATGVKGGVVVHVGCGNGRLTAAFRPNSRYTVHGLEQDAGLVSAARSYISSLGSHGPVSADQWDGARLPYIDGMVNLLVVEDAGALTSNEMMRVLAPRGAAYVKQGDTWAKMVKPVPPDIDDWTHYLYDATGICVSKDTVAGPPKRMQWQAGPRFNRHHDVMSTFNTGVSANGRIFYVLDEGSRESILLPSSHSLIARDACNGTLLWKRPISSWHPAMYGFKSGPTQLTRRLVAVGDMVYVTLDYYGPLVALDAATGETIRTYDQTAAAQEVICSDGILFVLVDPTPKQWKIWESYYDTGTCQNTPSTWWNDHPRVLTAINADTGEVLWTKTTVVFPTSFSADSTGLVYHDGTNMHKVARLTGSNIWTSSAPVPVRNPNYTAFGASTIIYSNWVLIAGYGSNTNQAQGAGTVVSIDSVTGTNLATWITDTNSHMHCPFDLFVVSNLVWSTAAAQNNPVCKGYDPRTGALVKTCDPGLSITWIHQRCYRSKATTRYFMTSRAGIEFIDSSTTNSGSKYEWARGACLYGIVPANGLVYTPPNNCACQFETKLSGLCALAPASADTNYPSTDPDETRLQPGPAYGQEVPSTPAPDDWPIYRHDPVRSSYTTSAVPSSVSQYWQTTLGGKLSSVTVAEGKVFVAQVDEHVVWALDADNGAKIWSYTVGGRVDSPPTIYQGRVIFGSADGYVYCLRATDGALIWRFLAAPTDLRHMSYDQLESVWPVSGSVLVYSNRVYCVSGRSMFLDGGCRFLVLDPTNGTKLVEQVMDDMVPGTTTNLATLSMGFNGVVALADLLSTDYSGTNIFMKSQRFDLNGVRTGIQPSSSSTAYAAWTNQIGEGVHLFTPTGFLDDFWVHRTYWVWGKAYASGAGGYYVAGTNAPCGQILSIDESNVYGFGRKKQYYNWTRPKENILFSTSKTNVFNRANPFNWTNTQPFFVRAMVLTKDNLYIAGPSDLEDEVQTYATLNDAQTQLVLTNQDLALNGLTGGQLRIISKADGNTVASYRLTYLPVWDGMATAQSRLYIATRDGRVICLR